jgi:catechol 2,3-dioxygenase
VTLRAVVERLVLSSPDVDAIAAFYGSAFGYEVERVGGERRCTGSQRSLWFRPGQANKLLEVHFRFEDPDAYSRFRERIGTQSAATWFEVNNSSVSLKDPEGRVLCFFVGDAPPLSEATTLPTARLQHYAVRSPRPQELAAFYSEHLGFTISDFVRDAQGDLSAVFLRTNAEHHALAIFRSTECRFDHLSCETGDWNELRAWADRMAQVRVPMAWGVGRHGPGNDTFFMVKDPDGNLAEISCDLEICAEDRPAGVWAHEARTLNLWGAAIMRS